MTDDALEQARRQGSEDAQRAQEHAPDEPRLKLAWAQGFGQLDQLQAAVDQARAAGLTWQQIADVLGMRMRHAQTKFAGAERQRRYRERRQAERPAGE
ncbi:MAG: hypothetical protein AB7O95_13930 [Geminicoccaceae bacterium]